MSWEEFVKTPDVAGVVGAVLGWLSAPGGTVRMQAVNLVAGLGCAVAMAQAWHLTGTPYSRLRYPAHF